MYTVLAGKDDLTNGGIMNRDKQNLDAWINQHLEQRELRLTANNPFVWHQASLNDLKPSKDQVSVVNLDQPIEFKVKVGML